MTEISIAAEKIAQLGPLSISNSTLTSWIVVLIICVIAVIGRKTIMSVPRGIGLILDTIVDVLINTFQQVTGDRKKAIEFLPFLGTFFFYIIINNWFGLLPGVGTLTIFNGEHTVPLLRGGNADINTTLTMALISIAGTQYFGIKHLGFFAHMKKYFNLTNPIMGFVGILELVGELARATSFTFRLFGNIFAGEVLLIVIASLLPIIAPLPFFGLELFVGLIQAIVFTMLTLVFMTIATSHQEH